MSTSTLVLHCGAREVTRDQLDAISANTPPATRTFVPVSHSVALDTVVRTMADSGFAARSIKIGVARGDHRLFATVDTVCRLGGDEVTLAVAVVNSTDKSLPMKMIAGSRIFCCDNLSLRSDMMAPIRKKHTRFGLDRFRESVGLAVRQLDTFQEAETRRIKRFKEAEVTDVTAESVLLRAFDRGILSHRLLPTAISEWREPSYEDFLPRTLWSLENALTTTLGPVRASNPTRFCALSLSLQSLLASVAGLDAVEAPLALPA